MRSTEVIGKIKRRLFLTLASYFYFSSSFLIPHFFLLARGLPGGWLGVPRDAALSTPSQPPIKSLYSLSKKRTSSESADLQI